MFPTSQLAHAILLGVLLVPSPTGSVVGADVASTTSLDPAISFVGGSGSERATVIGAVERFVSDGLPLPDLEVRFHAGSDGCGGYRGLFHLGETVPIVDLCYDSEFLALHELGHAWEQFNLDDGDRERFRRDVAAPTWNSPDIAHKFRAKEIAADAIAYGLLSAPLSSGQSLDNAFTRFESLTGRPTPRLAELDERARPDVRPAYGA